MKYFQVATPERRTFELTGDGIERSKRIVYKLNGVTDLYRTIYNFNDWPGWDSAIIDKVYIDFDPEKENPESGRELFDTRKLHEYLIEQNVQHSLYFSGRGFHIFVAVNKIMPSQLKNPRMAVKNCHKYLIEEAEIKPDPVTVDLMRIARLPNTKNMRTGLFCIPLAPEELYWDINDIYRLGAHQRIFSGQKVKEEKKVNLGYFDGKKFEIDYAETIDSGVSLDIDDDNIPECVKNNLSLGDCNYLERYAIITALRDLSYPKEEVRRILKEYLIPKKYNHCIHEERQLDYLFQRQDLLFPSCSTLQIQGMCVNKNKKCRGQHIYL
jgi:hypothetical protein